MTKGNRAPCHRAESMRAIDFEDYEPQLVREKGEQLLESPHFVVERWRLGGARVASEQATFAIFVCLEGAVIAARWRRAQGTSFSSRRARREANCARPGLGRVSSASPSRLVRQIRYGARMAAALAAGQLAGRR